jgi:hypothetical protein
MGGTAAVFSNRRMMHIRDAVQVLQGKLPHAPVDTLVRFARGVRALGAYRHLLNNKGMVTFKLAEEIIFLPRPSLSQMEDWLPQLPSAKDPKLNLFNPPFSKETLKDPRFRDFKKAFSWGYGKQIIQIADGCWNNCLMCAASAGNNNLKFMPFPMVLLLAKQLLDRRSGARPELYEGSDVMQWRDVEFDADYGDLVTQLKEMGIPLAGPMTTGFWPGDEYAEEAAVKYALSGEPIGLSVHVLHKEIFPTPDSTPNEQWLQKWAERYAHFININGLKPEVCLLGVHPESKISANPYFGWEYISEFYTKRILPLIGPELQAEYRSIGIPMNPLLMQVLNRKKKTKVELGSFHPEGRAFDTPYFPKKRSESPDGIYHSIWGLGNEGAITLKVGTDGTASALMRPRWVEMPMNPQPVPSQTVGELFPAPRSPEFKDFLRKLFFEACYPHGFFDDTIDLWANIFPKYDFRKIQGMFARAGKPPLLSDKNCRSFHQHLKHLPVVSSKLYYKFHISDLSGGDTSLKEGGPFSRYLYSLYTPTRGAIHNQPVEREANPLSGANGESQKMFLMSFEEGKKAIERLEESADLLEAIKNKNCTEAQLEEAYKILKDLSLLSPTFYLNVLELQTVTTLGFRARL